MISASSSATPTVRDGATSSPVGRPDARSRRARTASSWRSRWERQPGDDHGVAAEPGGEARRIRRRLDLRGHEHRGEDDAGEGDHPGGERAHDLLDHRQGNRGPGGPRAPVEQRQADPQRHGDRVGREHRHPQATPARHGLEHARGPRSINRTSSPLSPTESASPPVAMIDVDSESFLTVVVVAALAAFLAGAVSRRLALPVVVARDRARDPGRPGRARTGGLRRVPRVLLEPRPRHAVLLRGLRDRLRAHPWRRCASRSSAGCSRSCSPTDWAGCSSCPGWCCPCCSRDRRWRPRRSAR